MSTEPMTESINALSARTHFGEIMERVGKQNVRFLVNRRGKPKAVILGVEDYMKNIIKEPQILASIQLDAQAAGLDKMTGKEIEAEITEYRRGKAKK